MELEGLLSVLFGEPFYMTKLLQTVLKSLQELPRMSA